MLFSEHAHYAAVDSCRHVAMLFPLAQVVKGKPLYVGLAERKEAHHMFHSKRKHTVRMPYRQPLRYCLLIKAVSKTADALDDGPKKCFGTFQVDIATPPGVILRKSG